MSDDYTKHVMKVYRPEATYFHDMITGASILTSMKCSPAPTDTSDALAGFLMVAGYKFEHWIDHDTLAYALEKVNIGNPYRGIN